MLFSLMLLGAFLKKKGIITVPGCGRGKEEGPQIRDDGVQCRDSGKSGGGGHLRLDGAFLRLFLPDSAENCDVVAGNDVFYEGAGSEDAD